MALGIAGAMVANGDIDLFQQIDAFRSADRGARPPAPARAPTPPAGAVAPPPPAVEPAPEAVVVTLPSGNGPAASLRTRPAAGDRLSLAQELQGELQRVGCYAGTIDGVWTPQSQKAMKAFMERVNAQLPVDEPDYVHLALVRDRQGMACAKPCAPGPAGDNGCLAAKPAPERMPAALSRSMLAPTSSTPAEARITPAGQDGGANPGASPQTPGQIALAPGAAPPVSPASQQKRKAGAQKQSQGVFGSDIFKLFLGSY